MTKTILDIRYYANSNAFGFGSEDIQDVIMNNIDIKEISGFYVQDFETYELIPSNHLLKNATSILNIVREGDNNLYWGYVIELENGIKIETDLNVTYVIATGLELLFDYCSFIFIHFGKDPEAFFNRITNYPDQNICLTEPDEAEETQEEDRPF